MRVSRGKLTCTASLTQRPMARRKVNNAVAVETTGINVEDFLAKMPIEVRTKAAKSAIRKGGNVVKTAARRLAPVGGPREGRKAGKPHLRDTMAVRIREYGDRTLAVVGPTYPSGAHSHLIEFGFTHPKSGEFVPPQPYLRPAADSTKPQQAEAITRELTKRVDQIVKGM